MNLGPASDRSILFDLDGTLLDTAPGILRVFNQLCVAEGVSPLSIEAIRPAISHGSEAILRKAFGDIEPTEQQRLKQRFFEFHQQAGTVHSVFFPGIPELLEQLTRHSVRWGIVTNRTTVLTQTVLTQHPRLAEAGCIVSADTTPHAKPHPAPLLHACDTMGVDPKRSIYVGDAKTDIEAGRDAGMRTLLVLFGYADPIEAQSWQADHTVSNTAELCTFLQPWFTP